MANERTFLAWIRTSIGIMAFGFVVEKFALFVKQISVFLVHAKLESNTPQPGFSAIFGIVLVVLGAIIALFAFVRFRIVAKQIDTDSYRPYFLFDLLLTIVVLVAGVVMAIYLKPAE